MGRNKIKYSLYNTVSRKTIFEHINLIKLLIYRHDIHGSKNTDVDVWVNGKCGCSIFDNDADSIDGLTALCGLTVKEAEKIVEKIRVTQMEWSKRL